MSDLKENLAWLLHDLWAGEMAFVFGKYLSNIDRTDEMRELVRRINSSYNDLSIKDKEYYDNIAGRIIKIFKYYIEEQE